MAATLNNKDAYNGEGFIRTYRNPIRKPGKIFSKSLRWALKLNMFGVFFSFVLQFDKLFILPSDTFHFLNVETNISCTTIFWISKGLTRIEKVMIVTQTFFNAKEWTFHFFCTQAVKFIQTWFLKRKIAVWPDKYIIFSAKTTAQNAYDKNTGLLKSINSYADAIFFILWNLFVYNNNVIRRKKVWMEQVYVTDWKTKRYWFVDTSNKCMYEPYLLSLRRTHRLTCCQLNNTDTHTHTNSHLLWAYKSDAVQTRIEIVCVAYTYIHTYTQDRLFPDFINIHTQINV